jgi:hypothetical protein
LPPNFNVFRATCFFRPFQPPKDYDLRSWYAIGSYKLTGKLIAGSSVSPDFDQTSALGPNR